MILALLLQAMRMQAPVPVWWLAQCLAHGKDSRVLVIIVTIIIILLYFVKEFSLSHKLRHPVNDHRGQLPTGLQHTVLGSHFSTWYLLPLSPLFYVYGHPLPE